MSKSIKTEDNRTHYYVRLKFKIWPEIYGKQIPIHFPTEEAALRFARNNISSNRPLARIYTSDGKLVDKFVYEVGCMDDI